MASTPDDTKTPISFLCKRGLYPRSLIQPSNTLLVELTGTHGRDIVMRYVILLFIWIKVK